MAGPLVASLVTVLTGVVVLAFWSDPQRTARDRRSVRLGILHVAIAGTAVALWVVFVIGRASTTGAVSLGLFAAAALAGATTLTSSRHGERVHDDIDAVPVVVLAVHGLMAAATLAAAAVAFASR